MIAFLSDIHGNTEALSACLAEAERLGADRFLCLGDVIGYGPEPRQTLRTVMDVCELCLLGNHEHGAMFYASDFNPRARAAIEWTRDQLNLAGEREENMRLWNYLGEMKETFRENELLLVHGSPRDPVRDYIVPKDARDPAKMEECFANMNGAHVCFLGHSHVPGIYPEGGGYVHPDQLEKGYWEVGEDRILVNVGSVGQPRDGDTRAAFVTYDDGCIRFHRVEYDVRGTMEKIRAIPELDDYLAERLAVGR